VLLYVPLYLKGCFSNFRTKLISNLFFNHKYFHVCCFNVFYIGTGGFVDRFSHKEKSVVFISNILMSVLLLSDALYLRYYNTIITIPVIYNARYLGPVRESIMSLFRFSDIFYFLDIPVFAVMSFIFSKRAEQNKLPLLKRCVVAAVLMVVAFGSFKIAYSKNDMSSTTTIIL